MGASALAGAVIAVGIYLWYAAQISSQQTRNSVLATENQRLDNQIKDIAALQEEIAALRARQQAVEDLQADRNMPVHLLNELSRLLPDGVYLTSMKQVNENVALAAWRSRTSASRNSCAAWARAVPGSPGRNWSRSCRATSPCRPRTRRRVANFRMNVKVLRASEAQKAAAAASAAAGPASAASAPAVTAAGAVGAASAAITSAAVAAVTPASARK
jgi:type IV pilus assembly protein PilN